MPSVTNCTSYPVTADGQNMASENYLNLSSITFSHNYLWNLFGTQTLCCCVQFNRCRDRRYLEIESRAWSQIDRIKSRKNCTWRTLVPKITQTQTSVFQARKITPFVPTQKQHTQTDLNAKEQRVIDLRLILSRGILPGIFCTTYCCA